MASLMAARKMYCDMTCNVKQAGSKQDFAICGETVTNKYKFVAVCDGHGTSHTINYLRSVAWGTLLEMQDFIPSLMTEINSLMTSYGSSKTRADGSTLSVARIDKNNEYIECYWIGDSSIRVFANNTQIFKSKDHNRDNKEEVTRVSEECNMRGIQHENIWDIKVVTPTLIKSVPGALFDFGNGDRINFTHSLGHSGKTGSHYGYEKLIIDPTKTYKVVVGTDGFWDMTCDSDIEMIADSAMESEHLIKFANLRWRQEWIHDNTTIKRPGIKFPESNIDDIAVATLLIKPLVL